LLPSRDLFGNPIPSNSHWVHLYIDEIKPYRNKSGQQWMYIGVLAIPSTRRTQALAILNQSREDVGYDRELHFTKLRNYSYARIHNRKTLLAKRWVDQVMDDDRKIFHFNLLGINLDNLQGPAFGEGGGEQRRNIYNRFFRTALNSAIKWFFGKTGVQVVDVFHDRANQLEQDSRFDWHAIWRIGQEVPGVGFVPHRIEFVDSDHNQEPNYPEESHFIQLCDLMMGGLTLCLDARNTKDGCNEIAERLLPLAERLTDPHQAYNPTSHYHHLRRISMSFFPSKRLRMDELGTPACRATSNFYITRPLLLSEIVSGQLRLDLTEEDDGS